jgi:Transposase and inactivated derivatives
MQLGLKSEKLVFLDETSAKTNMTRLYGRAPIGVRLVDRTPHGHWVNTTLVCGLKHDGIVAPHAFTGAMNKTRFLDYLKRHLLPVLNKGDIVVMDNLSSHKGLQVEMLLASKGANTLYLPAYSPDLNPIELSFSKLKSVLRKLKIRDVGKLQRFLRRSPKLFSTSECRNYFRHAGYPVNKLLK